MEFGQRPGLRYESRRTWRTARFAAVVVHLDVAVNGFGHADDLDAVVEKFLGQKRCIGVGVIPAHNHQGVQIQSLQVFRGQVRSCFWNRFWCGRF